MKRAQLISVDFSFQILGILLQFNLGEPHNFPPPWVGPTLMACGSFGAVRLASARPIRSTAPGINGIRKKNFEEKFEESETLSGSQFDPA